MDKGRHHRGFTGAWQVVRGDKEIMSNDFTDLHGIRPTPAFVANIDDDALRATLLREGIALKDRTRPNGEPFGNSVCPCGSESRYDLCCGPEMP